MNRIEQRQIRNRIIFNRRDRLRIFRDLPLATQALLLPSFSPSVQAALLSALTVRDAASLLDYLDPDRASYALRSIPDSGRRKRILALLTRDLQEKVSRLLRFSPDTAASLVSLNYISIPHSSTLKQAAEAMRRHSEATGKTPAVLVLNEEGNLEGELPVHLLALESSSSRVHSHTQPLPSLLTSSPPDEAVRLITETPHGKIAVLDEDGSIIGIIYADDIIRLLREKPGTSLYEFAGVRREEYAFDSVGSKVRNRAFWLILNLGTAFAAAGVVSMFQATINQMVLLAAYMPVIAGMGGNAGTQTLAVMVRGIATGEVTFKNSAPVIWRETGAGIVNGVITGVLVALAALVWNQNILLGAAVGAAMVINLAVAGIFGSIVPILLKKAGKDPATSATIFITTATDVFGFFVFLGLASLLLQI